MNSKPSKSARKREHLALQDLGVRLIDLTNEQLETLELDDDLLDAVKIAKSMRAHGALRRQKQLIGKLMRSADSVAIRAALDTFGRTERIEKSIFKETEAWRARLLAGGGREFSAFSHLVDDACLDLQLALANHRAAVTERARRTAERQIFREIHKTLCDRARHS